MHTTRHFIRSVVLLVGIDCRGRHLGPTADDPNSSAEKETELLAVLRSDAPAAEKAITCKKLAIYGSSAAVPELAKLLPNPQLSSWARIALEAIPGEAADEALRAATDSLEGKLLVGTINSIGVRRDADAVDLLTTRLQDSDAEVASAAAVALGRIGNDAATKSLREHWRPLPPKFVLRLPKVVCCVPSGCTPKASRTRRRRFMTKFATPMFPSSESSKRLAVRFSLATRTVSHCCWRHSSRRTRNCSSSHWARPASFRVSEVDKAWRPRWFAQHPSALP